MIPLVRKSLILDLKLGIICLIIKTSLKIEFQKLNSSSWNDTCVRYSKMIGQDSKINVNEKILLTFSQS